MKKLLLLALLTACNEVTQSSKLEPEVPICPNTPQECPDCPAPPPCPTCKPYITWDQSKAMVTQIYKDCLCREPDFPGLENWAKHLLNSDEQTARKGICESPEGLRAPKPCPQVFPKRQIFSAGMTYSWSVGMTNSSMGQELDEFVRLCAAAGLPQDACGLTIELGGDNIISNWTSWKTYWSHAVDQYIEFVKLARARNIPIHLFYFNTNGPGKRYGSSWSKTDHTGNINFLNAEAKRIKDTVGFSGMLINAMNEDDSSTHISVREGVRKWFASNYSRSYLTAPTVKYGEKYKEDHPSSVNRTSACDDTHNLASDNGPIISELYGCVECNNFNLSNHKRWLDQYAARCKMSFYNLDHSVHVLSRSNDILEVLKYYKLKAGL